MGNRGVSLVLAAALMAAAAPSGAAPAPPRATASARVLARTVPGAPAGAVLRFGFAASHAALSWAGDEGSALEYRLLRDAGWSAWAEVPEAHDLEHDDIHYGGLLDVRGAAALQWRSAGGEPVATATLDYLDAGRTTATLAGDNAAVGGPAIVTRAEWGADESVKRTSGTCGRGFFDGQQLFVHHTAGQNDDPDPEATMRAIYWYHTVRRGWCDVGYNFVIAPDGRIFEGRWARRYAPWERHTAEDKYSRVVMGAHVSGYNSGSLGISLMGTYTNAGVPAAARASLAELLGWASDRHDLDPLGTHVYRNPSTGARKRLPFIAGHRDAGSTECPGGTLYRELPSIRRDAAGIVAATQESLLELVPGPSQVVPGEATISGRLTDETAMGMSGRVVHLYRKDGRGPWVFHREVTTDADGAFETSVTVPPEGVAVAAVYDGETGVWGDESSVVRLRAF